MKTNFILLVADENTFAATGSKVENTLAHKAMKKVIFSGATLLIPNEVAIQKVNEKIEGTDLIVGSGVIQDLCNLWYKQNKKQLQFINKTDNCSCQNKKLKKGNI